MHMYIGAKSATVESSFVLDASKWWRAAILLECSRRGNETTGAWGMDDGCREGGFVWDRQDDFQLARILPSFVRSAAGTAPPIARLGMCFRLDLSCGMYPSRSNSG